MRSFDLLRGLVTSTDVGAGVIDSDYTGRVKILLINTLDTPFEIEYGDRIAQLILNKMIPPLPKL